MSNGYFTPDCGTKASMECDICGCVMDVERGVVGQTARGGSVREYDQFTCPYKEIDWHLQAYKLFQEAKATPSGAMTSLYESEARSIIQTRKATKQVSKYF